MDELLAAFEGSPRHADEDDRPPRAVLTPPPASAVAPTPTVQLTPAPGAAAASAP